MIRAIGLALALLLGTQARAADARHASPRIAVISAAVAHVAYANRVPFVAFRSLSDLAGGDAGPTVATLFYRLASANSAAVVRAFLVALPGR